MRGARHAPLFVPAKRRDRIAVLGEVARENESVLDRLARALADVERHRVRGVAEERHAALSPLLDGIAVVQIPAVDHAFFRRGDDLLDRARPALEPLGEHRLDRAYGILAALGRVRDCEPVELRIADAVEREPQAGSVNDRKATDRRVRMIERRHDSLPDRVARVARLAFAAKLGAHRRVDAVSADQDVAARFASVFESSRHTRIVFGEAGELGVQAQNSLVQLRAQKWQKLGTVDADTVPADTPADVTERNVRDDLARVTDDLHVLDDGVRTGCVLDGLREPDLLQRAHRVVPHVNARADVDLPEVVGLFVDLRLHPLLIERVRRRDAADPAANDDRLQSVPCRTLGHSSHHPLGVTV